MGFEGRASESGEVDGDLSGTSWLKIRILCAIAVARGRAGRLGVLGGAQVKVSVDLRMIFVWRWKGMRAAK